MPASNFHIKRLNADDLTLVSQMLDLFGEAFDDPEDYTGRPPSQAYTVRLLQSDSFICLAALRDDRVIGALAAYELVKFEQERSEVFIYDLAVRADCRRAGVATQLILALKPIAAACGAKVMFLRAHLEDQGAIALYSRLGSREDVLQFDIATDD